MKDFIIISDTDSVYIELKTILDHFKKQGIEITKETKSKIILKIANKIQSETNNNLNIMCKDIFNIDATKHYFQLKQEVIAQSVIVTGKRRYAMFITNKEGVEISADNENALDLKGLEVMKSNMNKLFKSFGEELIKKILFGVPKSDIDKYIIDFYKTLKTLSPKSLGRPTGVSYLSKYIAKKPTSGEIFSRFESGAPINTKSAVIYNDLLKFKKLDTQYEGIIEGDKINIVNLKANPFQIETIAVPNGNVPKFIEDFIKQYIDIDTIFESILLGKLKELFKDIKWVFPNLNPNISKFFIDE